MIAYLSKKACSLFKKKEFHENPNNKLDELKLFKAKLIQDSPHLLNYFKKDEKIMKKDIRFAIHCEYIDEEKIIITNFIKKTDFDIIFTDYIHLSMFSVIKDCERDCSICLEKLKRNKKNVTCVPVKLSCGHEFHYKCISEWYKTNKTCPYCRKDIHFLNKVINI